MISSATHGIAKSFPRVRSVLAVMLGSCTLLAMPNLAAADDTSTLESFDHADAAMTHAVDQAMLAARDKQGLLTERFNAFTQYTLKKCTAGFTERQSRPDLPPIELQSWLVTQPDKWRCVIHDLNADTALFDRFTAEAKAGGVSPETMKALEAAAPPFQSPLAKAPKPKHDAVAVPLNPWNGSGAKLDRSGGGVFLSYTDASGAQHRYAVARPKMIQGMATGDTGSWEYIAPDKSFGRMFTVGAGGDVESSAISAMQIKLFGGQ